MVLVLASNVAAVAGGGLLDNKMVHGGDGWWAGEMRRKAASTRGMKRISRALYFTSHPTHILCWNISFLNVPKFPSPMLTLRKRATPHPFLPSRSAVRQEFRIAHYEIIYFCRGKPSEIWRTKADGMQAEIRSFSLDEIDPRLRQPTSTRAVNQ